MKDRLEKFVSDNRESFDTETPNERVWKRIARDLSQRPVSSAGFWIWKAAAIIFFGLSSFLLLKDYVFTVDETPDFANIASEFEETEEYYKSLISIKEQELDTYSIDSDFDYMSQLGNLNAIYQVLRAELEENPSKPVVDALILNLISRVDILNRELDRLEQIKEEKESEPAPVRS